MKHDERELFAREFCNDLLEAGQASAHGLGIEWFKRKYYGGADKHLVEILHKLAQPTPSNGKAKTNE